MKKLVLASVSALALLSVAACSDSTDNTTTQSVPDAVEPAPAPVDPATPAAPPATDNTTTQGIAPVPETAPDAGGDVDNVEPMPVDPAPGDTAPAQ